MALAFAMNAGLPADVASNSRAMGEVRPGVPVQRMKIQQALRDLLSECGADELTIDAIASRAGISRATFYRCFSSVDEVLMLLYDDFEQRVRERLLVNLPRTDEIGDWIGELVELVLRDAMEMGPLLRALFREELRPGSAAGERQRARIAMQTEMISRWWEATVRIPAYEGLIDSFILLLQSAGLRVADMRDEQELQRLKSGITFLICCSVERYREDPSSARIPELTRLPSYEAD